MKKLNKAQKKLIKEKVIKILHIVCYILSVLFILTMVVVGVQSCQKQPKKQSAETDYQLPHYAPYLPQSDYYVYNCRYEYNDDFIINVDTQQSFNYGIDLYQSYENEPNVQYIELYNEGGYIILVDGTLKEFSKFIGVYGAYEGVSYEYYRYRLSSVYIYYTDGSYNFFIEKQYEGDETDNYKVTSAYYPKILLKTSEIDNGFINFLYEVQNSENFIFNKVFNYNAPINTNIQSPYGTGGNWTSSTADSAYIDYETGYFISNGELYNKIRVYYFATGSMYFQYSDGNIKLGPSGSWSYMFMYYYNTDTNINVLVNQRDLVAFMPTSSSHGYYNANSATWVVDDYRYVTFLQELDNTTKTKINAFNNNNQTSYSGYVGSGDITNVFSLVGSAFSGLLPILSTYLLPGITIGMLLFIPLVAMLVFAIIRIIKK